MLLWWRASESWRSTALRIARISSIERRVFIFWLDKFNTHIHFKHILSQIYECLKMECPNWKAIVCHKLGGQVFFVWYGEIEKNNERRLNPIKFCPLRTVLPKITHTRSFDGQTRLFVFGLLAAKSQKRLLCHNLSVFVGHKIMCISDE